MSGINRYRIHRDGWNGNPLLDQEGDGVLYTDHLQQIEKLRIALAGLLADACGSTVAPCNTPSHIVARAALAESEVPHG